MKAPPKSCFPSSGAGLLGCAEHISVCVHLTVRPGMAQSLSSRQRGRWSQAHPVKGPGADLMELERADLCPPEVTEKLGRGWRATSPPSVSLFTILNFRCCHLTPYT